MELPVFAPEVTETVAVDVPGLPGDTLTLLGLNPILSPVGKPLAVSATFPAKPLDEMIVSSVLPLGLFDRLTVTVAGFTVIEIFPPNVTVRFRFVE